MPEGAPLHLHRSPAICQRLRGIHDFENRSPVQNGAIPNAAAGIPNALVTRFTRFGEQKEIKDLCAAPYVAAFRYADGSPQDRPRVL